MNIMKEAHKVVRETIAACPSVKLDYRSLFRAALVDLHKIAKQLVNLKDAVYKALDNNDEGGGQVYLDNAFSEVAHLMNRHQFAGYLSALNLEGKYQPQGDKEFGLVL